MAIPRRIPTRRPRLVPRQAQPLYRLHDATPTRLDDDRFDWLREAAKLIASVAMVLAAVLIWTLKPWL